MKETEVNEIVFCRDDFKGSESELFAAIGLQLKLLMQTHHICTVYADDPGIGVYVIQYEHDDKHCTDEFGCWGVANPYWLTPDQVEEVENYINSKDTVS